jgi:NitT/TauT family transport system substrate-binding protein
MSKRKKTTCITLLTALLLGAAGRSAQEQPARLPHIRIGHVGHDHHLALYVAALESAARQGEWGLHLREQKAREVYDLFEGDTAIARLLFIQTAGGAAMPAAMSRGEIDVGLGGTTSIAKFADGGQPIRIICPLQTDGDQLVLRKGSGIADWAAFVATAKEGGRPLRIGYKEPMAVAKMVFEGALRAEGIEYGFDPRPGLGVVLVNFGSEHSPLPLLESRALDGFVMNQPGTAMAVHRGLAEVVAELRDLPPDNKWLNHPCCVIAATDAVLQEHPEPIKALLKLIQLSTHLINTDVDVAVDCAVRWIRNPREVEAQSIPTSSYLAEPNEVWLQGMVTWFERAREVEFFTGKYQDVTAEAFVRDLCALDPCRQAAAELREKGLLPQL